MCGICFSIIPTNEELPQRCWFDDTILPQLLRRGPDSFGQHEEVIPTVNGEDPSLKLFFAGTVLHLRGAETKQPLVDENGNVLLWNGEIFDGIKVQDNENDTQVLMKSLGNYAEEADSSRHILKTLSRIRGPWSLVYWQARQQRVWFGRDYFGRRSLLWHLPTDSNGVFSVVSVASASSSSAEKLLEWEELPADGVYCIDLSGDLIGHSVLNSGLYKIRKFLWISPDLEHRICDKENPYPKLCSPVSSFNAAVPSDEDLKTALENHMSKFFPPECRDKHQSTCFADKSDVHGELSSDEVATSDHKEPPVLETPLDCTNSQTLHVSEEGSCNSSKESQLADEEKHISSNTFCRKQSGGKTLSKCNVSAVEDSFFLCSERVKKSHDMSELVDMECKECGEDTSPTTWNKNSVSSADAEASGSKTKKYNGTFSHGLKGLNVTERDQQLYIKIQREATSNFPGSTTILHDTSKSSDSNVNLSDSHHSVEDRTGPSDLHAYLEAPQKLLSVLGEAVRKRVTCLPRPRDGQDEADCSTGRTSHVGVLFSGGIDSIVIAALADRFVPPGESIDLINVAFEQKPSQVSRAKDKRKNKKQAIDKETKSIPRFDVPDRLTGKSGLKELRVLNPDRQWNFVEVDVTIDELQGMRSNYITHLVYPLETVLDDSIGCALWFAARGEGTLRCPECVDMSNEGTSGTCSHPAKYTCQAKVLLVGMGADEQLGGYSRHRTRFSKEGWVGLMDELQLEVKRISTRNLGRDDRCVSDHGREARFPFLDEDVVSFLNGLPVWIKTDPRLPRGTGEKILLRQAARLLGLTSSAQLPKRAIQFGSRIAKLESSGEKGSDACSRLKNKDQ